MSEAPRYKTPPAFARALTDAAKRKALDESARLGLTEKDSHRYRDQRINQLRRDVAFHAILVRLSASVQGDWVVKGGVALQLRLDPSRPSLDIDVTWSAAHFDHATALAELRKLLAAPGSDFFSFEIDPRGVSEDTAGSLVLPVTVLLGGARFERFTIDLAPPREHVSFDMLVGVPPPLGLAQVGEADVRVLSVASQLADKLCAMHERRGEAYSSRWRDLADVAMLAQQIAGLAYEDVRMAVSEEASRRPATLANGMPVRLSLSDSQISQWRASWGSGGRHVPLDFDAALQAAQVFADPVLSGEGRGSWDNVLMAWRP